MGARVWKTCGVVAFCAGLVACTGGGGGGGAVVLPTAFAIKLIATKLIQPMQYKANPTTPSVAYVLERPGRLRLMVNDVLQTTPILDLSSVIAIGSEGGLLGMAFDPNFASNRYIFVHCTIGATYDTQIYRYTLSADMKTVVPGSQKSIIRVDQRPFDNHKGGSINFGSDGFLYLALGDGGDTNDSQNNSQNKAKLIGKINRIDTKTDDFPADAANNYGIPPTNPYLGVAGVRGEIWDFGMRNPFRWSVDPSNGALLIADVGQDRFEELNYEAAGRGGRNYGWRVREGYVASGNAGPAFGSKFNDPFFVVTHPAGEAIIGGYIYQGNAFGALKGRYLFGDYITNVLWSIQITYTGGEADKLAFSKAISHTIPGGYNGLVSIDPDKNGEPIVTELNTGHIFRLVPVP